jgi:hypothetical protein
MIAKRHTHSIHFESVLMLVLLMEGVVATALIPIDDTAIHNAHGLTLLAMGILRQRETTI